MRQTKRWREYGRCRRGVLSGFFFAMSSNVHMKCDRKKQKKNDTKAGTEAAKAKEGRREM